MAISDIIQITIALITLISVILIFRTIKSNETINQRIIFNEIVKQERELKIALNNYRRNIHKKKINSIE